ncbi:MAG: methyltransferase domain-containing protein, partial [Bacteroidota bacterium]
RDNHELDLSFLRDFYTEKYASLATDLLTCRHVISVINDPVSLLRTIRKNLDQHPDTIVYFDTPNLEYTFRDKIIWNVVYEHRSWFGESSLRYLLESTGFEVLNIDLCWQDEYIGIEARPKPDFREADWPAASQLDALKSMVDEFTNAYDQLMAANQEKVAELQARGLRCMAWGAGARAVSFFNLFDLTEQVPDIVDINVKRQGKYLPGTAQSIVTPEYLKNYHPELVIITNPTYADEIKAQVHELGIQPEFWVL